MIIETERLILRPFRESDAADVLEYLAEPAVNCFASMKLNSPEEASAEMKRRAGGTEVYFGLGGRGGGKGVGGVGG
mgnify:CR=1 FL=1